MRCGIIFALLILFGSINAAGYDFAYAIVPGAIIFSVILVAIANMIGDALSMPAVKSWAQIELRELIVGGVLIAVVFTSLFLTNQGVEILTGQTNVISAAEKVTGATLGNITAAYRTDILISSRLTAMSGYSYRVSIPIWFFGFSYTNADWTGYSALLSAPSLAAQGLANSLYIYTTLNTLLKFFNSVVPFYILPLGFAFRMIPFTRKIGNTIIALAIGAYVMYPFSIILVGELHKSITYPNPVISSGDLATISLILPSGADWLKFMCQSTAFRTFMGLSEIGWWLVIGIPACIPALAGFIGCFMGLYQPITAVIYPLIAIVGQIAFSAFLAGGSLDAASNIDPEAVYRVVSANLKPINNLIVITYVDALVVAITTYVSTKGISAAIGGEADMMGLQRMV